MAGLNTNSVRSPDATEIAYWSSGDGPPLLLIHGTTADHTRWAPLLPHLEPHLAVHAMDRRGRGDSGDGPDWDIGREFGDVAAVVDAIAKSSGTAVDVYGHSFGGLCALGAAPLTSNIGQIIAYEGWPAPDPAAMALPAALEQRLEALLAAGDREGVIETFFREVLMMSGEQLEEMRAQPAWHARVAAAHTIGRELAAEGTFRLDPDAMAQIMVPVLLLGGEESGEPLKSDIHTVAAALPDARISLMPGQGHAADVFAPHLVAERILPFVRD